MELANLQHGRILTLEVVPLTDVGLEKIPANRRELIFTRAGDLCALILPAQDQPLLLGAPDHATQRDLRRLANQETPRLCWLVAVRTENNQVLSLTIQIHEFSERVHFPQLKIGVDEKLVADIERQLARRFSVQAARTWLAEQLFIPPAAAGQQTRALLIGRPDGQTQTKPVFRILGSRYALDVQQENQGGWQAFRLTRPRTALTPEQYRPIILAEGDFEFVDRSIAGQMRQGMATELDQIVRTAGSYLGVWLEYQAMEARRLVEDAKRFGWLSYDGCHRSPDGCWTFQLTADSQRCAEKVRGVVSLRKAVRGRFFSFPHNLLDTNGLELV